MTRKFTVMIDRVAVRTTIMTVEAESEGEAEGLAYEKAGDVDFSDCKENGVEYEVVEVKEAGSR
jgi:hypothetical protein